MAEQFNPLDPLGIFGLVRKDVDRIAGNPKTRFIGGCKVSEGRCLTHGYSVSKTVTCPESGLTDEEWQTVWELTEEAFPHGQRNPRINSWWPKTMDEVERTVARYGSAMREAASKYAAGMHEAAAKYSRSVEKAIYHYRQYCLSEYYKGYPARV